MAIEVLPSDKVDPLLMQDFVDGNHLSFIHLDWVSSTQRIGQPGCFALFSDGEIKAMISCAPENDQAAWIRFFISVRDGNHELYFRKLLDAAMMILSACQSTGLFALPQRPWMKSLVEDNDFLPVDEIVNLYLQLELASTPLLEQIPGLEIRQMKQRNLLAVEALDEVAFHPEWRLNFESLQKVYQMSSHATVAVLKGVMVGYQAMTSTFDSAHLARLAVTPFFQGKGIGQALASEMLAYCTETGMRRVTVNTQRSNVASLNLYRKLGFVPEDFIMPVYCRSPL